MGFSVLQRSGGAPVGLDPPLSITHQALGPLESFMKCVEMNWMTILVGPTGSGKTSLVRLLALLTGNRLRVMPMNSAMDTTELLGGFEQVTLSIYVLAHYYCLKILDSSHVFHSLGGYYASMATSS